MTFRSGTEWDAEDIVQEAFYLALKYHRTYDGVHFDQWFSTILNNALRKHKNIEKGHPNVTFEEEESEGTPCPQYPNHIMAEVERRISRRLPLEQREALHYHFVLHYSPREISEITSYSYAGALKLIERFRNELKEAYG